MQENKDMLQTLGTSLFTQENQNPSIIEFFGNFSTLCEDFCVKQQDIIKKNRSLGSESSNIVNLLIINKFAFASLAELLKDCDELTLSSISLARVKAIRDQILAKHCYDEIERVLDPEKSNNISEDADAQKINEIITNATLRMFETIKNQQEKFHMATGTLKMDFSEMPVICFSPLSLSNAPLEDIRKHAGNQSEEIIKSFLASIEEKLLAACFDSLFSLYATLKLIESPRQNKVKVPRIEVVKATKFEGLADDWVPSKSHREAQEESSEEWVTDSEEEAIFSKIEAKSTKSTPRVENLNKYMTTQEIEAKTPVFNKAQTLTPSYNEAKSDMKEDESPSSDCNANLELKLSNLSLKYG